MCCNTFTRGRVPQQPDDFGGKRLRARRQDDVDTGLDPKSLGSQRGSDDTPPCGPRFQNLDSSATASAQRGDHDLSLRNLRPRVLDGARDLDSGLVGGTGR